MKNIFENTLSSSIIVGISFSMNEFHASMITKNFTITNDILKTFTY